MKGLEHSRTLFRSRRGLTIVTLSLMLSLFVLLSLSLLSFEMGRANYIRTQLRAVCDSAALAGAATLAGADPQETLTAHQAAAETALNMFKSNSIGGKSMSQAFLASAQGETGAEGAAGLYVEFLDPNNNYQPVGMGDPKGKVVNVIGSLEIYPAFGSFLQLGAFTLSASGRGGVPKLDLVLCFDVSGSIDDQTPVTFVRRTWNSTASLIDYIVPPARSGAAAGSLAQGKLYDILGPPTSGSRVNAISPQYLSVSNQSDHRWPLTFSEDSGTTYSAVGLRGATNTGTPPGNCPPGTASGGGTYTYTDLVVNIDGNDTFQGLTRDGYSFPDVATLVEAARGNLENYTVFQASKADKRLTYITPQDGYRAKYIDLAREQLQPIKSAQDAVGEFLTTMNTNCDAHFGFVAFCQRGGSTSTDSISAYNVDSVYTSAGYDDFALPQISLSSISDATNYSVVYSTVPTLVATTSTNIGDALYKAVNQLKNNSRFGAKKAIVLFTDGVPTSGQPLSWDPYKNTRLAAVEARNAGIAVYTIGLAQNPEIVPLETEILNDTNKDSSTGGVAAIAGHGGKFFLVSSNRNLLPTFQLLARHLVQLR